MEATDNATRPAGERVQPNSSGGIMNRARLCIVLALLAGFSLHGQTCQVTSVKDVSGGTNFAPGGLAILYDGCFGPGASPLPTATVGGQNAYSVLETGGELEIQIPFTAPLGANIPVGFGGLSVPITVSQYAPILMPQAAGASAASAWHSDGTPVSPAAPAMPNETINIYAVGLGPISPAVPAGGAGQGQTTAVPTVTLAGNQLTVLHATLGGAGAGIYQIYFTMPAVTSSGNQNVSVGIGGVTSNTLALAVGPAPAVTAVLNNYSYILPTAANYGIAPGSIFVIFGTGMATPGAPAVLQDSTKGLPLTLNGASVGVTVAGVTEPAALYYATPAQIAAVLPSTMPLGTGTIAVTYDQMTSAPAPIQVVLSALGLATMSGDGTGQVMATDANYNFISPTSSAAAGQIITLWGSGLGADTAESDTTYSAPNQIPASRIPLTIYIGGVAATVVWAGRSGYPGLDQINVQILAPNYTTFTPTPAGCSLPLTAVGGTVVSGLASNNVTLPVALAGGPCMEPAFVLDPSVVQPLGNQAIVSFGALSVSEADGQPMAGGAFYSMPGAALAAYAASGAASAGSCIAVPPATEYQTAGLDTGPAINATASSAAGQQALLRNGDGEYGGPLPASWTPSAGETFTFVSAGGPGTSIGAFSATASFPAPLEWTNQSSIGTINRSQGVQLTWTGGDADGVVAIRGTSFAGAGAQIPSASFMCSVPASAGQFTVPASVLRTLPAGAGTLTVENQSAKQAISASGLDLGYAFGGAQFTINAVFN